MTLGLPAGETEAGPWRPVPFRELLDLVLAAAGAPVGRPRVVAIDGRGAAGKSTLAAHLLREAAPRAAVVHTDDLAWHEPLFGWGDLLAGGVLAPLHRGEAVSFRPPRWQPRGREGSIEVPAGLDLVLVEGTGASQVEHAHLVDATVWVQSDFAEAESRGIARDVADGVNGGPEEATTFWHDWMAAELAFLDRQRPWLRADVVVHGSPPVPVPDDHVLVAPGLPRA